LKKALLKPTSLAYQAASEISLWQRDHNAAVSDGENAIALDPNSAGARVVLANALIFSGQPEMAMKLMDNAEKLDPFSKARYEYVRGLAFFGMEQYDKAAASLERARELNPEDWATNEPGKTWCYPCEILAATYGHLGRTEDAAPVIAYLDAFGYHRSTIGGITPNWPYKETEDTERFSEGLRKAGLPD
jgi:tetratricopeptide (TPR) repeat protein